MSVLLPDPVLVHALTVFAVLVVLVTRQVLPASGRRIRHGHGVSPLLRALHFRVGLAASLLWMLFLVLPGNGSTWHSLLGLAGLGAWWVTGWVGLFLLGRWLPSRGRRSHESDRGWILRFLVSVVGHVGVALSTVVFTLAYVLGVV